jgi:hypothetical protein
LGAPRCGEPVLRVAKAVDFLCLCKHFPLFFARPSAD